MTANLPHVKLAKSSSIPRFNRSIEIMSLSNLHTILALAPSSQPGQSSPPAWTSMLPLVLIVVMFYFVLLRPQQKKAKEHEALLKAVRSGDKIVTSSGIVGVVISVKEKTLSIRSADAKLEITK